MDIETIRKKRTEAETAIAHILTEFCFETSLFVKTVTIDHHHFEAVAADLPLKVIYRTKIQCVI